MKTLKELTGLRFFSNINREFAFFIEDSNRESKCELTGIAALWLSYALDCGHVCLDLNRNIKVDISQKDHDKIGDWPSMKEWTQELQKDSLVEMKLDGDDVSNSKLFILTASGKLYLQRYWNYENKLASILVNKNSQKTESDLNALNPIIDEIFENNNNTPQKNACISAHKNKFCVITGGPGTGKTTTILNLLISLIEIKKNLRIKLTAPTGKAAARMKESISSGLKGVPDIPPEIESQILHEDAQTIHRLLGYRGSGVNFHYNKDNKLPLDILLVDECSMIDLPLMTKLFEAVPNHARIIMLGDKDQLAAVGTGSIFGDICDLADNEKILQDAYTHLTICYRNDKGIAEACKNIREGQSEACIQVFNDETLEDITRKDLPEHNALNKSLKDHIGEHLEQITSAENPENAFNQLKRFRILCALRKGPYGTENINDAIIKSLKYPQGPLFKGLPIIIRKNDYSMKLFNGDTGIIFPDPENVDSLCAWFPKEDGGLRKILPGQLPDYEPAYAMTIHKSQGSEFDNVLIILSDKESAILTRELLYTAISRAKKKVSVWSSEPIMTKLLEKSVGRISGLEDRFAL